MAISDKTLKLLWGRAGGRCSFPRCSSDLARIFAQSGDVVLGEMAHVIARSAAGPRADEGARDELDDYDNLVLLCPSHHREIDKAAADYPAATLREYKRAHEGRVRSKLDELRGEITGLEVSLRSIPDAVKPAIEAELKQRRVRLASYGVAALDSVIHGKVTQTGGEHHGASVGVNLGTIVVQFFGGTPPADGEALLRDYLDAVASECRQLRLSRLTQTRRTGGDRSAELHVGLDAVFMTLATDAEVILEQEEGTAGEFRGRQAESAEEGRGADDVVPREVRSVRYVANDLRGVHALRVDGSHSLDDAPMSVEVFRPEVATEAVADCRRLVLLGEPGSGKSTVLRHLALALARLAGGDEGAEPDGWPSDLRLIPLFCPLGRVAAALSDHQGDATRALHATLQSVLNGSAEMRDGLGSHLKPALRRGNVLLLFDGLDELTVGDDEATSVRTRVARAIRELAAELPKARFVVTSRVKAYEAGGAWQLPTDEGWAERRLLPLRMGQVTAFVRAWYGALATVDDELTAGEATARSDGLLAELRASDRLQPLVESPLLLTMLAVLHYNKDELPADRARLYEECVQLLLQRWEPVRTVGVRHAGLLERLGDVRGLDIDGLRRVLHELAFEAQASPPGEDGRGQIAGIRLRDRMLRFFAEEVGAKDPLEKRNAFLSVIHEDVGLLVARADDHYAFPHLTFQEYLAACHLADRADMVAAGREKWHSADGERWREVLLLLIGRLRQKQAVGRDGVPWIQALVAESLGVGAESKAKPPTERRRDAVLAALTFAELGGRAAFAGLQLDVEDAVVRPLRRSIQYLLEEHDDAVQQADRFACARVLGEVGDHRTPVTVEQWSDALREDRLRREFGQPGGYWCWVPPGTYSIGGWEGLERWGQDGKTAEVSTDGFWIARYPVTVEQFRPFVEEGYRSDNDGCWSPHGLAWKREVGREHPRLWDEPRWRERNQPVIGVTWYEATAFSTWLSRRLEGQLGGCSLRLPTEAEWEVAAAYDSAGERRLYPWGEGEPDETRLVGEGHDHPAPVGACPRGRAACGAVDVAGNVWEWCGSTYAAYPGSGESVLDIEQRTSMVLRGSGWGGGANDMRRCGARHWDYARYDYDIVGFRLVLSPRSQS